MTLEENSPEATGECRVAPYIELYLIMQIITCGPWAATSYRTPMAGIANQSPDSFQLRCDLSVLNTVLQASTTQQSQWT